MELSRQPSERQPIVFDIANIDDESKRGAGNSLANKFHFGWASFDNPLYDLVAMDDGIDDEGHLDMERLDAVEKLQDYLEGRQGQPILMVDIFSEPEGLATGDRDLVYITGYIAQLSGQEPPLRLGHGGGIAVQGKHANLHGYTDAAGAYNTQYLTEAEQPTLSLKSQTFDLGKPGEGSTRDDLDATQVVVAGEEILPWIKATFSPENQYVFYMDVVRTLLRNRPDDHLFDASVLDTMIDPEFVERADNELAALSEVAQTLTDYERQVTNLHRVIDGKLGEANLSLEALRNRLGTNPSRLPYTQTSHPISVTADLDTPTGPQIEDRFRAIKFHSGYLATLVNHAAHNR